MRLVNWLVALKGLLSTPRRAPQAAAWRRGRRSRQSARPAACVQALEPRVVLSATYTVAVSYPIPSTPFAIEPYGSNAAQWAEFVITRDNALTWEMVNYTLGGTAGSSDYQATVNGMSVSSAGWLMFMTGETQKRILINPVADFMPEQSETVTLTLSGVPTSGSSPPITILDAPPPTFSQPSLSSSTINEGSSTMLSVTASQTINSWTVNWGDGVTETIYTNSTSLNTSHVYADDESGTADDKYQIQITANAPSGSWAVNKKDGQGNTIPLEVTVNNVAPSWAQSLTASSSIRPSQSAVLSGSIQDPANGFDNYQYSLNWGDGTSVNGQAITLGSFAFSHPYLVAGSYAVTLAIVDGDGGSLQWSGTVNVVNHAPVISVNGPEEIEIGEDLTLDASESYDPDNDSITYLWDLDGNGSFEINTGTSPLLTGVFWDTLYTIGFTAGTHHEIGLRVTDSFGLFTDEIISLDVKDEPGEGSIEESEIQIGEFNLFLNSEIGTFIGSVAGASGLSEPDDFTIIGGAGASYFTITDDGDLHLAQSLNESIDTYELSILGSNASGTNTFTVTVYLLPEFGSPPNGPSVDIDYGYTLLASPQVGNVLGEVPIVVDGAPADSYAIISGDDSGLFTIDLNGQITLAQLPATGAPESYLLEVAGTSVLTGNTVIATVAFLVEQPFVQAAPVGYTGDTVITKLGGKEIMPTKFGDLNVTLQTALRNPSTQTIAMHDINGTYFVNIPGEMRVVRVTGPKSVEHPQVQWQIRLLGIEKANQGTVYYEVFKLKEFFKSLREATANLQFAPNPDPQGQFAGFSNGTMLATGIMDAKADTIIHESVHALDWKNRWYLPNATSFTIERIEALGWTTAHMVTLLARFKTMEETLGSATTTPEKLNAAWYGIARDLNGLFEKDVTWRATAGAGETSRRVKTDDIADVTSKVKLDFSISTLMTRYQAMAAQKGVSYTFSLTNLALVSGPQEIKISVPTIFRH